MNVETIIKVGKKKAVLPFDPPTADLATISLTPIAAKRLKQLTGILANNGKKFDWCKAGESFNSLYTVVVAGCGPINKAEFVWFKVTYGGKTTKNHIVSPNANISLNDFLSLPSTDQNQIVNGNFKIPEPYNIGDVVKFKGFADVIQVGRILSVTKKQIEIEYKLEELSHGEKESKSSHYWVSSARILKKLSPDEVKEASKTYSFGDLSPELTTPDKHGSICVNEQRLHSLAGCPVRVEGSFVANRNFLDSLVGGPVYVGGTYDCSNNHISTLDGLPKEAKNIDLSSNNITSIVDIHKHVKRCQQLNLERNDIKNGFLHLFFIKELRLVMINNVPDQVKSIINRYLPLGKAGLVKAQVELLAKGFDQYTRI